MTFEDLCLGPVQRRLDGAQLREKVDAVALFLDHARNNCELALDAG